MDELSQRKRKLIEDFLSQGTVKVYVDSTVAGVKLPLHLMHQPQVAIHLSYEFGNEVFIIDDVGITVSLASDDVRMNCVLPWVCMYLIQSLTERHPTSDVSEVFLENLPHALLEDYGLTMRILRDEPTDDIPISRPLHSSSYPVDFKSDQFNPNLDRYLEEVAHFKEITGYGDLRHTSIDDDQHKFTHLSDQESWSDQDEQNSDQDIVFSWVQGLEKIDGYRGSSSDQRDAEVDGRDAEVDGRDRERFSPLSHLEPTISHLLEEVIALAEEESRQKNRRGYQSREYKMPRRRRQSERDHLPYHARLELEVKEGEHSPEQGIFSLAQLKRDLDST